MLAVSAGRTVKATSLPSLVGRPWTFVWKGLDLFEDLVPSCGRSWTLFEDLVPSCGGSLTFVWRILNLRVEDLEPSCGGA